MDVTVNVVPNIDPANNRTIEYGKFKFDFPEDISQICSRTIILGTSLRPQGSYQADTIVFTIG